jgi:hypothetical protein
MRLVFKILAITLFAGLVAAALAPSMVPAFASPRRRPAGCHEQSHTTPPPGPVSYSCCQTGHGAVLVEESPAFAPLIHCSLPESAAADQSPAAGFLGGVRPLESSPASPPRDLQRRI